MQKLGFPTMKSLEQLKSRSGSPTRTGMSFFAFSSRPPSSDSLSMGSFANLKLAAEKLVKEQASVKSDLEMANTKLKKSMEQIHMLEEKLQNAFSENTKLKVKQKEDEKLWEGLESKFSSTKALCDQLTETLQQLAGQVQDAEKDKDFFEDKLSASSTALDVLNQQMAALSVKLDSAEDSIKRRDKELEELKVEKKERDKCYRDERQRMASLIEQKDAIIKKIEANLEENARATEELNSRLEEVCLELRSREDEIKHLVSNEENLEKDKKDLQMRNHGLENKLVVLCQGTKNLENSLHMFAAQLVELDKQASIYLGKFDQLNSLYDICFKLVQQKMDFAAEHAKKRYELLHGEFSCMRSEKDALQRVNQEVTSKLSEVQEAQELVMAQLSEECRAAGKRIHDLESQVETHISKKIENELLVSDLQQKISSLQEITKSSEEKMNELLANITALEMGNKDNAAKFKSEIEKKDEDMLALQKENEKNEQQKDLLANQVDQLRNFLEEKERLILQHKDGEKKLEDLISENQASLVAAESRLAELRKQYDIMLESKQMELSRHLKELCQKNDQAINEIRRKYDLEKQEIVDQEKEKADKAIREMAAECDKKLVECKEESRHCLMRVQEEHAALVNRIRQENDVNESNLKAKHSEEIKRAQLQAENEMREKTTALRSEHEAQMKAVRFQYEDECRKLQEELCLQRTKEERQRALLQLQWRVMGDVPQEDPEVNSRKEYSINSKKMRHSGSGRRTHLVLRAENDEQDSPLPEEAQTLNLPLPEETQTPVSKLLKRVENAKTGSVIPKHSKKVTRREYEVETTNGRMITKRRKTKSTVMFEDPRKHRRLASPRISTPKDVKGSKGVTRPLTSNIGDLFSEGSLNPYVNDPYAFD